VRLYVEGVGEGAAIVPDRLAKINRPWGGGSVSVWTETLPGRRARRRELARASHRRGPAQGVLAGRAL